MERRNTQEWIKDLKIAFINEDISKLEEYSNREVPEFSSVEEAKEALNLINQITQFLQTKKQQTAQIMRNLKQSTKYSQTYTQSTNNWNA